MKTLVASVLTAAAIGFSALSIAPAAAAVPVNPLAQALAANVQSGDASLIQVSRRGGRGFHRGHRGHRGHGFHRGHRFHRGHHWKGYYPAYYGGCHVRTIWTDWGPVRKRFCY